MKTGFEGNPNRFEETLARMAGAKPISFSQLSVKGTLVVLRYSAGKFPLASGIYATHGAARGFAESADVNVQLPKSANEGAPVHSQHSGGFALIPIDISQDHKDKRLPKFFQRFEIEDARPVHPEHQCLKLSLRGIRMFSTHVQPGEGSRIGIAAKSAGALAADAGCHESLPLQISYAYQSGRSIG